MYKFNKIKKKESEEKSFFLQIFFSKNCSFSLLSLVSLFYLVDFLLHSVILHFISLFSFLFFYDLDSGPSPWSTGQKSPEGSNSGIYTPSKPESSEDGPKTSLVDFLTAEIPPISISKKDPPHFQRLDSATDYKQFLKETDPPKEFGNNTNGKIEMVAVNPRNATSPKYGIFFIFCFLFFIFYFDLLFRIYLF